MHILVQKWGNSLAFRIPRTFAQEADISQGTTVDLGIQKGRLVITPVRMVISLKDLLAKVSQSNIHREENFGTKQGLENW